MKPLSIKLDNNRLQILGAALGYAVMTMEPQDCGGLHEYYLMTSICQELYEKVAKKPEKIKLKYYQLVALEKLMRIYQEDEPYRSTVIRLMLEIQPHLHQQKVPS